MTFEKITPANYITLRKKLCNAKAIIAASKLANEWGLSPVEACYRLLNDALVKEYNKRLDENSKR